MLYPAPDSFAVVQHLVNRDRESVLIAEHGLGKRIADKNDVDGNFIYQTRARVVVCSQAGDRLVSKFLFFREGTVIFLRGLPIGVRLTMFFRSPSADGV